MAITSAICNSFKQELLVGTHNFTASSGNTFKIALYTSSATLNKCQIPYSPNMVFDQYYDCARTGYDIAKGTTNRLGDKFVNENRIVINFSCKEFESI